MAAEAGSATPDLSLSLTYAQETARSSRSSYDSPLEGNGFELVWGFSLSSGCFWFIAKGTGAAGAVFVPQPVPGASPGKLGTRRQPPLAAAWVRGGARPSQLSFCVE